MGHPLERDPFAAAQIDEAMRDLDGALEADDRQWLREQLAVLLQHDPHLRAAYAGARPHELARSGAQPIAPDEGTRHEGTG